jgi:hypothetical protein
MTLDELQTFATEIGATLDFCPVRLTLRRSDCIVSITIPLGDRTYDRRKIARLLTDKIDAVFCPSEDLLILKERLEQVR